MGPLLAKLERGHAVTVLAWGTSITSDHGGCYHDSMEHMKAMMPNLPNNYGTSISLQLPADGHTSFPAAMLPTACQGHLPYFALGDGLLTASVASASLGNR